MLIGLIPGPSEPKENIDFFLEPLVNDLLELWNGVQIHKQCDGLVDVRRALIAVSSDIPAAQKLVSSLVIRQAKDAHVVNLKLQGKIHVM